MSREKTCIVQVLVRTNIPELNGECSEDGNVLRLWMDTAYVNVKVARDAWPSEAYREVEVLS